MINKRQSITMHLKVSVDSRKLDCERGAVKIDVHIVFVYSHVYELLEEMISTKHLSWFTVTRTA